MMQDMKKNIRRVFWLYFGMFLMIVLYLSKFILVDSQSVVNSVYNPRMNMIDPNVKRGSIIDGKGNVVAESQPTAEGYERRYPYSRMFAHVAGYTGANKSGVESKFNFNLQNLDLEIIQRIDNLITESPLTGDSIHLTLDADLQKIAYDGLGSNRGGVVAMEPSTGKILAMVSYPNFDPNTVYEDWETLRSDDTNSPLLNRASQGLYPPGSVFKIVMASAIMTYMPEWEDFVYNCTGEIIIDENRIRCYNSTAHGSVGLGEAMKVSCNTYFAQAGLLLEEQDIIATAEKMYFNQGYDFDLERVQSRFSMEEGASLSEVMETAIGQGKTLATPLHMAMVTSAVANGGKMMAPYVSDYSLSKNGGIKNKNLPEMIAQILPGAQAGLITEMMTGVVTGGTGSAAAISGVSVAGKTGTAQNASDDDHGWFVAFAPADQPRIAVAVVIENAGGSRKAVAVAKDIIQAAAKEWE